MAFDRKALATEPPYVPVAPKTRMVLSWGARAAAIGLMLLFISAAVRLRPSEDEPITGRKKGTPPGARAPFYQPGVL